jgi:hypothetical protein
LPPRTLPVAVINLQGQAMMPPIDNAFRKADEVLEAVALAVEQLDGKLEGLREQQQQLSVSGGSCPWAAPASAAAAAAASCPCCRLYIRVLTELGMRLCVTCLLGEWRAALSLRSMAHT